MQPEGTASIKPIKKNDPLKDVKEIIKNHNGEWSFDDLHTLGEAVAKHIDTESDPLIKERDFIAQQREDVRAQIADLRKQINALDFKGQYDKADELEKRLHELESTREGFSKLYYDMDNKIRENETKRVLDTLTGIREFGGVTGDNLDTYADLNLFHRKTNRNKTKERSIEALNYYPKAWLDASATSDTILCPHWTTGRAYYQHYYYSGSRQYDLKGRAEIRFDGSLSTNIHELGHRMEKVIPGIMSAEKEFYDKRTAGEELKWLGAGYGKKEKSRRDHFMSPYMGKDYGGSAYELVSMGFQSVFTNYEGFKKADPEMLAWTLGLLAGV